MPSRLQGRAFSKVIPVLLTPNGEPTDDGGFPGTDTDGALDDDNINQTLDFGFKPDPETALNLGDFVWLDVDGNGRNNDASDLPLEGATVELLVADPANPGAFIPATDNDGNPVGQQVTDATGNYNFVDLLPGDYFVRVTPPAEHYPTSETAGNDTLIDSNGTGFDAAGNDIGEPTVANTDFAYSQSEAVTLSPGTEPDNDGDGTNGDLSIDFGFWTPVSLGNTVWFDNGDDAGGTTLANVNNGILDGDEAGIEGVTVFLFRNTPSDPINTTPVATTTTNGDGVYSFEGLQPGSWSVYLPPSNFAAGEPLENLISSTGNGVAPDPDTGGVNAPDNDDNGDAFDGGPEATNGIIALATGLAIGGEPITDGDTDPDSNLTIDFGIIDPADLVNLGDTVWNDLNNNGILDAGEAGIDGVEVQLFLSGADPLTDTPQRTTTTAGGGLYEFDNLEPGDYFVYIPASEFGAGEPLDGLLSSNGAGAAVDPDDNEDNDDNGDPINGLAEAVGGIASQDITLSLGDEPENDDTIGDTNNTLDFGVYDPATLVSLGDTVFLDDGGTNGTANDGVQDGDEAGITGVQVLLFAAGADPTVDAPIRVTTTGADGNYLFADILPGDYQVFIPQTELDAGGPLEPYASSNGNGLIAPSPEDDVDGDDNGTPLLTGGVISAPITLTLGGEPAAGVDGDDTNGNMTVDFGFTTKVCLGDTVFFDNGGTTGTENDGIESLDEIGIGGVTLLLFPAGADITTDAPLAQTVTNSVGHYKFDNLAPGDYIVVIPADQLAPGSPLENLASSNGNGLYAPDPDDDVQADDNGSPDGNGNIVSSPITLTVGGEDADDAFDSDSNNNSTVDFGITQGVSLGDTVFADTDNSGTLNGSETGIANVIVELYPSGAVPGIDPPILTDVTDADGLYQFDNLAPGDYFVHIPASEFGAGAPLEDLASSNGNGVFAPDPDDDVQSDDNGTPDLAGGGVSTADVSLTVGGETGDDVNDNNNSTVDLGFTPAVSLGDFVWADTDNSGDVNGAEEGIADVEVQLFLAGADVSDPTQIVATVATDADGLYQFDNLAPGDYIVYIPASEFGAGEPLENLASSNGNGDLAPSPEDNVNDDDNGTPENNGGVVSAPVTLTVGGEIGDGDADANNNDSIDFGFTPGVSLGNTVFVDPDNSGTQETGEAGITGVTVQLFPAGADPTSATPLLTDITDASGNYLFPNLAPGDYFVFIPTQPALDTLISSTGNGQATDPDDDINLDDDGEPTTGGFASGDITLAVGEEPTDDGDASSSSNLSVDFGFTNPTGLLSLGDTVFGDTDNSGILDGPEEGIPGVIVELYLSTQTPGVDPPFFTTTTGSDGTYSFENLNPGDYVVYLPAANFQTGGPLVGSTSSTGNGVAPSPNDGVENDDNGEPDGNGGIVSQPIALTSDDTSVDFGIAPPKAQTFAEFLAQNPGAGGATDDPDWDGRTNLEEFALCLKEGTGLNGAATGTDDGYGGFCIELVADLIDGTFRRPVGVSGVTYTLQYAPDLGAGTTIPVGSPTWTDIVLDASNTTSVDQGDGSEIVTITDLETLTTLTAGNGFVRLLITLDDTAESVTTKPQGWQTHETLNECQTFSYPFEDKQLFGGKGTISGNLLDVSQTLATGDDIGAALRATGANYYIEVTEGDNIGHRFEIDEQASTATEIALLTDGVLCGGDDESTQVSVPADLDLDMIVVRRFRTLDELFPPASYQAGGDIDTGANLLFFDQIAQSFVTYFLLDDAGTAKWVQVGDDPTMLPANGRGDETVAPGEGLFTHNKATDTFSTTQIGTVRCNPTVQPLKAGYNLLANAYPVATSPDSLGLNADNGFTGTTDPDTADQALTWLGDDTPGALGYDGQFYLVHDDGVNPPLEQWNGVADATLTDTSGSALLESDRSIILDINAANPTYTVPAPFTAN